LSIPPVQGNSPAEFALLTLVCKRGQRICSRIAVADFAKGGIANTIKCMRKWIARLPFTFLIVGGLLFYQAYELQGANPPPPAWQLIVIVAGGALAVVMGLQGIRMRHQQMRNGD
jgi:hypothetical protein